jgi:phage-related protein
MVVLHAFIKKARATPAGDLALARANKQAHERSLM